MYSSVSIILTLTGSRGLLRGESNTQVNRDYHRQGLQILYLEGKGVKARGYISKDQFVVMAGSEAVRRETNALREHNPQVCSLREELRERRVLRSTGKIYRLTNDYPFNSSSQAASFLLGNPFSGPHSLEGQQRAPVKRYSVTGSWGSLRSDCGSEVHRARRPVKWPRQWPPNNRSPRTTYSAPGALPYPESLLYESGCLN